MERTFSPMIRQYSAIDGLQQAYTLVYAMEVEGIRYLKKIFYNSVAELRIYFAPRLFSTSAIMSFTSCPTCMKFLYKMRSRSSLDLKV